MNPSLPRITLIAGLMAAALPAAAQNVQIYGIADAGVAVTNFDGKTTTAVRENRTARWGLRGAEKLGGGLQVIFRLESEVDMGTGRTDEEKGMFARQAWVGLKSDTWGTVRIGQTKGLFDDLSEEIDPFRNDGIVGDFTKRAWRVDVAESRVSNSITYEAPKFSGLEVKAQYSFDETPGQTGSAGWSMSAMYEKRDLTLVAAFDRPITTSGAQSQAWMLGAAYQFGPVRLSAAMNRGEVKAKNIENDGYTVGAAWEVGNGIVKGVWSKMDTTASTWTSKSRDLNVFGLGYDYPLSKRTTLYSMAVYETEGQRPEKTFIVGKTKGAQVGITHRF